MSEIRITEAPVPKAEKEDTPEKLAALDRLMELQAQAEDGLLCTYEKESKFTFEQVCRLMADFGLEIESEWREWGVVEIAVRNPQVAEYCDHWEKRTEKAESKLTALSAILDRLKELENAKVNPGPWGVDCVEADVPTGKWLRIYCTVQKLRYEICGTEKLGGSQDRDNLKFIAALRNALPRLLRVMEGT